jgi:hypothetical protein
MADFDRKSGLPKIFAKPISQSRLITGLAHRCSRQNWVGSLNLALNPLSPPKCDAELPILPADNVKE